MVHRRFRWSVFAIAALSAAVFHTFVLVPVLLMPLVARREAPLEVSYRELPPELPPAPAAAARKIPPKSKPPDVAHVDPPKPRPPQKPPEPTKTVQVKPPPPVSLQRMKMVDQDRPEEEPDNPEARYLAQKNHRTVEDTRTLATNLVQNVAGGERAPSEKSENQLPQPGAKAQKVAELAERKGKEHQIVRSKSHATERQVQLPENTQPGKLSMRGLLPEVPPSAALRPQPNLTLGAEQYDRIIGEAVAERERRDGARAEKSHSAGRWERTQQKLAAMRQSLENFVSEARIGNQAELGTRAHPFAAYIAEMHRSIHKLWAFGFLSELDAKAPSSDYNDMERWTQIEIVLRGDGSVEKTTIVRPSGYAPFDAAAIDAILSSAPYSPPPEAIRSANGKVYLDWRFHRDDRQCGTFGVDPHILTSVGENRDHDTSEVAQAPRVAPPRLLQHPQASTSPEPAPAPNDTVPGGARDAAQGWLGAYQRGDVRWLAGWSATPFLAAGQVAANDGAALKRLYTELVAESPTDRKATFVQLLSAGGIRALVGGLPPGGEGDGSMFFAVTTVHGEQWVLLVKQSDHGWRVAGFAR